MARITVLEGDLTVQDVDVIVNAANGSLRGGGGVDGAIHRAAGPGLLAECIERYPDGCPTGSVRITGGHDLRARHVIHAVGPVYRDGAQREPELLAACYTGAIALAAEHAGRSIAFPAISCGAYGYPWPEAAAVAAQAVHRAAAEHPGIDEVRLVLFGRELYDIFDTAVKEQQR